MRRYYIIILLLSMLTSCEEYVNDLKIDYVSESRLLVYAFPSDADSYLINVSITMSVFNEKQDLKDLHVTCTTNGIADEVTLLNTEEHFGLPIATFKATGKHQSGDKILIKVESNGMQTATATTTIPKNTDFKIVDMNETTIDNTHYTIFKMGFHDAESADYYAVRLLEKYENEMPYDPSDPPIYTYPENPSDLYTDGAYIGFGENYNYYNISTAHEPLLSNFVDLNLEAWNEYYKGMYFFDDKKIKDPDVTMHIYAESCYIIPIIQFFTLSKEFYKMLESINSHNNNELGSTGLSQIFSTYSNVTGGYGCVAGYTCRQLSEIRY